MSTKAPARPAAQPARKPLLSRVPADFVRAVLKGHSGLGLAFAAAIYLVCLTGSIAVFAQEFQRWEHADAPRLTSASPEAVQAALENAIVRAGTAEHGYIQLPDAEIPHLVVNLDTPKGDEGWIADGNGTLVAGSAVPWTEFITGLHISLHLPRSWGEFLVGLTGVALLSSLISGLLAHPRIFRDAFHLRLGGSRRLQEADLHNRLGVWAMPFHLAVSLTGALLGLTTLIVGVLGFALFNGDVDKVYGLFLPADLPEDARAAPVIDLQPMFAQLEIQSPGGRVDLIQLEHPQEAGGSAMFQVEREPQHIANIDSYAFDRSGKLYHSAKAADNNLGEDILASIGQVHFGWFGGGIVKIAYGLLGLGLTYLAASGVTIWLARRRDKRNASPGWERVWTGFVWGQPAALALTALIAAVVGTGVGSTVLVSTWGAVTLLALAGAAFAEQRTLGRWLALLTTGALVATGAAHALLHRGSDPVAWAIDVVFVVGGAALGGWILRRPSRFSASSGAS
ncbi:MAG: PepSY-associated TM helix domain-containing protein [Candidatus Andeanibacterium colombiense]|uniref:PepSY-associated TM helix domain-containing protein n=1 Tax=Candidatus Andeanibacterium colombiense TaxID=3121345 RepID=A0AAJ5X1M5_9SPHN|nr:MAG: PepSY-associated TM helix domain-containing protein [Sphingomonadaceae bacterium]